VIGRVSILGGTGVDGHRNHPPAAATITNRIGATIIQTGKRGDWVPDEARLVSLIVLSSSTGCGILA
jgi:hypothetical protein